MGSIYTSMEQLIGNTPLLALERLGAQAGLTARLPASAEGILTGSSSGAALHGAMTPAAQPEKADRTIVVLLPDTGERYLSTSLFREE